MLLESYSENMRNLSEKYHIREEAQIWRARLPDFRNTEEEKQKHKRIIDEFGLLHQTMQNQYRSAVRDLRKVGMKESDTRDQLYCLCQQLRTKPFSARLMLMIRQPQETRFGEFDRVYWQIGKRILTSLPHVSQCRLLTADHIRLILCQRSNLNNPVNAFRNQSWLLASAAFLVERLCHPENDVSSLWPKLDVILRVLLHESMKQGLCSTDDIVGSKDSDGYIMSLLFQIKYLHCALITRRLTKQLCDFFQSADRSDFVNVGKIIVHGLWEIYAKQETSKEKGYAEWELKLKEDALDMLLKFAFRNRFDTQTTGSSQVPNHFRLSERRGSWWLCCVRRDEDLRHLISEVY